MGKRRKFRQNISDSPERDSNDREKGMIQSSRLNIKADTLEINQITALQSLKRMLEVRRSLTMPDRGTCVRNS